MMQTYNDINEFHKNTNSKVEKFVSQWKGMPSLKDLYEPNGLGTPEDVSCLDYVIYENLDSLFFESENEFL